MCSIFVLDTLSRYDVTDPEFCAEIAARTDTSMAVSTDGFLMLNSQPAHHVLHGGIDKSVGKATDSCVSRCGLAVKRSADKRKDLGSIRFGSPFSSKIVVLGYCPHNE